MPDTGYDRHDATSSEEESEEEIILPKKKSFGIRVAQSPQQAQQQVLSQIGQMANHLQANEVVVQQTKSLEKSESEKKALEERQKLQEAQQVARAQQAAALQAAAVRVASAQANAQGAQQGPSEEEIRRKQEAAQLAAENERKAAEQRIAAAKAQQEAAMKAAQEQAQKAQKEALARAQAAQLEAQKKAQAAQEQAQKAQKEALARAQAAQLEAQKKAQAAQEAQKKAQQEALNRAKEAQAKAQAEAQAKAQAQKAAAAAKIQSQQPPANAPKKVEAQQVAPSSRSQNLSFAPQQKQTLEKVEKTQLTGAPQKGTLAHAQPIQQEVQTAAGPKWSRTPGRVQTQGPQPEQSKQLGDVAPPKGKTALRQTAQIQEQELANEKPLLNSPIMARKPQIRGENVIEKFVEKTPQNQPEKIPVQKGAQLEGAKRWIVDSAAREAQPQMDIEHGPKAVILQDDSCWQTQRRVAPEINQPQIGKIQIPELGEKEIQRTIVAQPASYHKVEWNEFPEEPKYEITSAPKTKTQEWIPVNQEQAELQRSLYKPSRIGAVWPPPQDEIIKEGHSPIVVKANEDTAWIQQDQNDVLKQAVWGKTSRINRVWPPPENENSLSEFSGPQHMPVVQWPPPEAEAHEREQIEVLQKHIPTKKIERQWPPPPPQYQVVESSGEIETRYNPAEIQEQQQNENVGVHGQQQLQQQQQQQFTRTFVKSQ